MELLKLACSHGCRAHLPLPHPWCGSQALILSSAVALILGWPLPSSFLQSLSSSPQAQPPRPAELSDEEVAELFQRLAEMQQEKWMLEEKVLSACWHALDEEAGVRVVESLARPHLMCSCVV